MPAKTYHLSNAILGATLCNTTYSSPSNVYVGLFNVLPSTPGATGTECSGSGYARQQVAFTINSSAPSNLVPNFVTNTGNSSGPGAIVFPQATFAWGTITGVGIFDALQTGQATSPGNLLYYATLSLPQIVNLGDQVGFPIGSLPVTLTSLGYLVITEV